MRRSSWPRAASASRSRQTDTRRVIDASRYLNRTGRPRRRRPHDAPGWTLVAYHFYTRPDAEVWDRVRDALLIPTRRDAADDDQATASGEAVVRIAVMTIVLDRLTDEEPEVPVYYSKKVT